MIIQKTFIAAVIILFVVIHLTLSANFIKSITARDASLTTALYIYGAMQHATLLAIKKIPFEPVLRESDAYMAIVVTRYQTERTYSDAHIQINWIDTQWKYFKTLIAKNGDNPANQEKLYSHCDRYWKTLSQIIDNQTAQNPFSKTIAIHILVAVIFLTLVFVFIRRYIHSSSDVIKNYDPLTHIYNSRMFYRLLAQEIAKAERYERPLGLVLFDVDFFRRVNDFFGHKVGDDVLEHLALLVDQNIRKSDLFCRVGGEEFAVIASETDLQQAIVLSEKIRKLISGNNFKTVGRITVSLGAVQVEPKDTPETLYKRVNERLQIAKKKGRNRTVAKN
ncbi:MAG: GGDEF domain-containing protein [Candidatus Magnetomorum sp.]|nr:GGDEF domain-containing protein [Candidatus Magnetomorum sp.]